MPFTLDDLVAALDLAPDPASRDRFVGRGPSQGWQRVFGGLLLSQALVAMARTVVPTVVPTAARTAAHPGEARPIHALHALFVRPGDPDEPIDYAVERLRDGRSFTARSCAARQHGLPAFTCTASFQAAEAAALDHQAAMPEAPAPDRCLDPADTADPRSARLPSAARAYFARNAAVEIRLPEPSGDGAGSTRRSVWMRAAGRLPDDAVLHAAVLAYMSDLTLLDAAAAAHGRSVFDRDVQAASLDHAIWFHRPARADGWLLYAEDSPSASGARGFARGAIYDRSGALVASTAQEGLLRLRA